MKSALLFCLLAVVRLSAGETNTLGPEPTYEGKPVSYWMGVVSVPTAQPQIRWTNAVPAFREMGMKATPFIIRYSTRFGRLDGRVNQLSTGMAVNIAFRCFNDEDKLEIEKLLPEWLKDSNPQIRANAVSMIPPSIRKDIKVWDGYCHDPSEMVRDATSFKTGAWRAPSPTP
jgi:hypothetical protein